MEIGLALWVLRLESYSLQVVMHGLELDYSFLTSLYVVSLMWPDHSCTVRHRLPHGDLEHVHRHLSCSQSAGLGGSHMEAGLIKPSLPQHPNYIAYI